MSGKISEYRNVVICIQSTQKVNYTTTRFQTEKVKSFFVDLDLPYPIGCFRVIGSNYVDSMYAHHAS